MPDHNPRAPQGTALSPDARCHFLRGRAPLARGLGSGFLPLSVTLAGILRVSPVLRLGSNTGLMQGKALVTLKKTADHICLRWKH